MAVLKQFGDANEISPLLSQLIGPHEQAHGVDLSPLPLDETLKALECLLRMVFIKRELGLGQGEQMGMIG